jgi:hypothetical protein
VRQLWQGCRDSPTHVKTLYNVPHMSEVHGRTCLCDTEIPLYITIQQVAKLCWPVYTFMAFRVIEKPQGAVSLASCAMHEGHQFAKRVDQIIRCALHERFPPAKAVGDSTGLGAGRLASQDVGRSIADHQGVRWRTV